MDKPLGVDVRKEEPEKPEPQPDNAEDSPEEQMPEEGEAEGQEEKEGEGGEEGKPQEGDENGGDDQGTIFALNCCNCSHLQRSEWTKVYFCCLKLIFYCEFIS